MRPLSSAVASCADAVAAVKMMASARVPTSRAKRVIGSAPMLCGGESHLTPKMNDTTVVGRDAAEGAKGIHREAAKPRKCFTKACRVTLTRARTAHSPGREGAWLR